MRLVDIDRLVSDYMNKNKSLKNVTWFELTDYEVKAIPIEWMKKWLGKLKNVYDDSVYQMLEDWEKENEDIRG